MLYSTMRTLQGRRAASNSVRTSFPISVVFRSWLVSIVVYILILRGLTRVHRFLWPHIRWSICQNARVRHYARWVIERERYLVIHLTSVFADVLLVNQTSNTLQNLCLDFVMLGDLKLVDRPGVYTIAPHGFQSIEATIKVLPSPYCLSPVTDLPFCEGLFNRNRCHFWQYLVGRTCDGGGLCHIKWHSHRYHGLHQAHLLQ